MNPRSRPTFEHLGRSSRWSAFAKRNWPVIGMSGLISCLYAGSICAGLLIKNLSFDQQAGSPETRAAWSAPSDRTIPLNLDRESIRRGKLLFDETPLYAPAFVGAKVSCSSCHEAGGIQPFAAPVVGMTRLFPMYNQRAGRIISLQDRIQECFVRSENGRPLDPEGQPMQDLLQYIAWLSEPQPEHRAFTGRGFPPLPTLTPDPMRGQVVYAFQCAGCHGEQGQGKPYLFPPVWGVDSYNSGAGMDDVREMAEFVHQNMPQNRKGTLSVQESYDVSAYIHAQPRPAMNPAYAHF